MLRMLSCAGVVLMLGAAGCAPTAETPAPLSTESHAAADRALTVFHKLVNQENFKALGLDSPEEAKQAQLGEPLEVFNVGLDQLKAYKSGDDPGPLLTRSSETVYPLLVNGQVRSSVTVVQKPGGFEPSSFGNADVVKRLVAAQKPEGGTPFIVRVPALNIFFLGNRVDKRVVLTPIIDDRRADLRAGETLPADAMLSRLVPIAMAYNGQPM